MAEPLILVINMGGSSSKFAVFKGSRCETESTSTVPQEIAKLPLSQQRPDRMKQLQDFVRAQQLDLKELSAVAARGGLLKPLSQPGVYAVDEAMREDLTNERYGSHPSNLSALIARDLLQAESLDVPVFVVDPVSIDTIWDEARLSGVPEIERSGRLHALNVFRVVRLAAEQLGKPVFLCNFVVGHFGSGVSCCTVTGGRCVDVNDAQLGEGPFSVSRAGTLPLRGVLDLAYGEPDREKLERYLSREAGLAAYTGTTDFREIEQRVANGDPRALQAYRAMVHQSVKYLAAYAGALGEEPDAFVLTGGLLNSERFARDLTQRLDWMAPVVAIPGEDEMAALAGGAGAALSGNEPVLEYSEVPTPAAAPPRSLREVLNRAMFGNACRFIVAGGHHPEIAETVRHCLAHGISGFTLFGPHEEMTAQLAEEEVDLGRVELVGSDDVIADALDRVDHTPNSVLVKGKCDTAALFKAVLKSLPADRRPFLSHVAFFENPLANKLVGITDGGLNVDPDLEKKIAIMENAILALRALGVMRPRVLLAAGMEDRGQDFPAIADAREIVKRHREGAWSEAIIDGPFGVDIALSSEATALKGIQTPVAGLADIIVTPNLEACNIGVKLLVATTGRSWAGIVVGGPVPMVVGSRADPAQNRVISVALAQLVAPRYAELRGGASKASHA